MQCDKLFMLIDYNFYSDRTFSLETYKKKKGWGHRQISSWTVITGDCCLKKMFVTTKPIRTSGYEFKGNKTVAIFVQPVRH